jgi:hypothetical protein
MALKRKTKLVKGGPITNSRQTRAGPCVRALKVHPISGWEGPPAKSNPAPLRICRSRSWPCAILGKLDQLRHGRR